MATAWVQTYLRSFDNLGVAMLAIYESSTTSLWLDVMYYGTDATGVGLQPIRDFNRGRCVFFLVIIVVCCFFMLNLFVGVTIDKFVQVKEATENSSMLLTENQKQWVEIQSILMACAPQVQQKIPKDRIRRFIYKVATSEWFDVFIMGVIFATIFTMCMRHANESMEWANFQTYSNIIFSGIFLMEAILKLIAFGPDKYFKDRWNAFDFFVVCVSFVSVAIDVFELVSGSSTGATGLKLIRVLRVARLFRLIPRAKRLLKLFKVF